MVSSTDPFWGMGKTTSKSISRRACVAGSAGMAVMLVCAMRATPSDELLDDDEDEDEDEDECDEDELLE